MNHAPILLAAMLVPCRGCDDTPPDSDVESTCAPPSAGPTVHGGSVSEDDVMCLADPEAANYTRRERLALKFLTLMCTDHHAIVPATYLELAEEFSTAEIVELGWTCAQTMGGHRFMHTLDLLGDGKPVLG